MKKIFILMTFILMVSLISSVYISADDNFRPEGKLSPYSEKLCSYFAKKRVNFTLQGDAIKVTALAAANDPLYIGFEQSFVVHAPASQVIAVIEDFKNYPNLFDDIVKAEVTKTNGSNRFTLSQEQKIPVPFLSNLKYDMSYCTASPSAREKHYIYRLCSGKDMKYNDGMILVKQLSDTSCAFYELDFIYGNWSALGAISSTVIWESVIEGAVKANMVIKFKAENPQWDYRRCKTEAKKLCSGMDFAAIVKNKVSAQTLF